MKRWIALLLLACSASLLGAPASRAKLPYFRPRQQTSPGAKVAPNAQDISVVNAASFLPGVSPGAVATIFGQNLSDVGGVVVAPGTPLPPELAGVTVLVNSVPAPLYSVAYANGEDQLSFQVPYETPTGPGAAIIQVLDNGDETASLQADSYTEDPGIFIYQGYAIAVHADFSLVNADNPASPGEIIVLYANGLGPLTLNLADGDPAPSDPLAYTVDPSEVLIGNESCKIFFSGAAPGFVGLNQVNLRVPYDAPAGDVPIQIQTPYANSQTAAIPVD